MKNDRQGDLSCVKAEVKQWREDKLNMINVTSADVLVWCDAYTSQESRWENLE